MAPVEIRFLSSGWETHDGPAKEQEVVNPGEDLEKEFKKGKKRFRVTCGAPIHESTWPRREHLDDGGTVHFWDESTELNAPEGDSLSLDRDIGNIERAHAHAEIGKNGSVKLTVDGEDVAEVKHVSR